MKRLLLLMLCLVLLCGCTREAPTEPTTTAPQGSTPAPTVSGLYLPDVVLDDRGAVRCYRLDEPVAQLAPMGDDLLVVTTSEGGQLRLRILFGTGGAVRREKLLEIGAGITGGFQANANGVCYYNALEHTLVTLDPELTELSRVRLPEQMVAEPVVSPDLTTVYYCTASEIRALSLETGVSRLLKQQNCQWQRLLGLAQGGQMLISYENVDGQEQTGFISTQDGRTLGTDTSLEIFQGGAQTYFLRRKDGTVTEYLCGSYTGEPKAFSLPGENRYFHYCDAINSVVAVQVWQSAVILENYQLETGLLTSKITMMGVDSIFCVSAGKNGVWFVAGQGQDAVLCCWDLSASAQTGSISCIATRYTAQAPDTQGLARCQQKADELGRRFGVRITVTPGALRQPQDYELTGEHQVVALEQGLAQLEKALARFPEDFFRRTAQDTDSQVLEISLVRDISGDASGLQYWLQADALIALELGGSVEQNFYHEICHVLDSFIYANTRDLDAWDQYNPQDFRYDNSYELYKTHDNAYLEGEDRAFIDAYSRTYPKEDRARILEYAMMPGNEDCFAAPTMQKKLRLLCVSIRSAFDWQKDTRSFPWEQYLEEPLAYKKRG